MTLGNNVSKMQISVCVALSRRNGRTCRKLHPAKLSTGTHKTHAGVSKTHTRAHLTPPAPSAHPGLVSQLPSDTSRPSAHLYSIHKYNPSRSHSHRHASGLFKVNCYIYCNIHVSRNHLTCETVNTVYIRFFIFFWPRCTACRILFPQPGIEPVSPAVEARSSNHWTTREIPILGSYLYSLVCHC